jgi:hypothetical protein
MVGTIYAEWMSKNRKRLARGEITEDAMFQEIRTAADAKYKKLYSEQWGKVINGLRVPSLRMANPLEKDEDDDLLGRSMPSHAMNLTTELRTAICPEVGVEALTKMTLENLENHNIKILWAAAQNNSADLTSEGKLLRANLPLSVLLAWEFAKKFFYTESIKAGMEYFNINMAMNVVPLIPVVSGITFWRCFTGCFSKISPLWNLIDDLKLLFQSSVRMKFIRAIFDTNTWGFLALLAVDVLGIFDAPATASVLAKAIAGIVLIHDILFVIQKEQWGDNKRIESLSVRQIEAVLQEFQKSKLRGVMMTHIDGSTLFTKCYSKDKIGELIYNAIDLARSKHPRTSLIKGTLK